MKNAGNDTAMKREDTGSGSRRHSAGTVLHAVGRPPPAPPGTPMSKDLMRMTAFQLEASAQEPCSSTIVGFTWVASAC
jgi:hypothetical protein